MKKLILIDKGGPWEMQEVPIPKPKQGEILVKVLATSVCNQTDLNAIKAIHPPHEMQNRGKYPHHLRVWDNRLENDPLAKYYNADPNPVIPYPSTMGHEGMGIVTEIGEGAGSKFKVGDRVSLCCDSTFAQYVVTTPLGLTKVPDNITDDEASLFEPWSILWGACQTTVTYGSEVCILGQGALGLFATQWAKMNGAKLIITSDPIPVKRELSRKFGADYVIDPTKENVTEVVDRLTNGKGCDVVFECAGVADTIANLPYVVECDGTIVQVGACCEPVLVDWSYIHFKGIKVHSSTSAAAEIHRYRSEGSKYDKCMSDAAREKENGRFDIASMITHYPKFTVEGVTELFREIDEKATVVKAIFHPWEE